MLISKQLTLPDVLERKNGHWGIGNEGPLTDAEVER